MISLVSRTNMPVKVDKLATDENVALTGTLKILLMTKMFGYLTVLAASVATPDFNKPATSTVL